MPITMMIFSSDRGVQNDSTAMVAMMAGKARNTYMMVEITASNVPRRYAANIPSGAPIPKPISMAPRLTSMETREPKTMREKMSRPRSSVPSRWCSEGPSVHHVVVLETTD
jgi:hypothetical protein